MDDLGGLIEACRGGDALAWETLVRRFQARIYGLARHYVRDPEEARDLAQDIFVRIYRKLGGFQGGDAFVPWMLRVARNCCIDRIRRLEARPPAHDVPADEARDLVARDPTPESAGDASERRRMIERALAALGHDHREVLILKEIQGLRVEEISSMLGVPSGTVKSRAARARAELARVIVALDPSYGS